MLEKTSLKIDDLFASDRRSDHLRESSFGEVGSQDSSCHKTSSSKTRLNVPASSKRAQSRAESPEFLTDLQVAQRYGISRATVWRWASKKTDFPAPISLSAGTTRWNLAALIAFEKSL